MSEEPTKRLTSFQAIQALDEMVVTDPERAHGDADDILLATVPKAVREAYERVVARARWWARRGPVPREEGKR